MDGASEASAEKSIPLLRSCERCRRRKQRCDGEQPVCSRCRSHQAECSYRQSGRFRKRFPRAASSSTGAEAADDNDERKAGSPAKRPRTGSDALTAATALSSLSAQAGRAEPAAPGSPHLPALSPCTASEASPNDAVLHTPRNAVAHVPGAKHAAGGDASLDAARAMDPVAVLRAYSLPDLAQGLPEHIVRQMWALVTSPAPGAQRARSGSLSPNMALLDPQNTAAGGWRRPADDAALAVLGGVAQRHALGAAPALLLRLLRAEHADSGLHAGVGAFWAALDAGLAADFDVLAHVAVAAASAAGDSASAERAAEVAAYEAARRTWERGHVAPSASAVCALLQLSEYGHRTGRAAVHWEFAHIAAATARQIVFRGHAYPWRAARITLASGKCDTEYDHVLRVFWAAWTHRLAAAQVLARRVAPDAGDMPELPAHDTCAFAARFPPAACCRRQDDAYARALALLALAAAPVHAALMDVREGHAPAAYFAAVHAWDAAERRWRRDAWPDAWDARLARVRQETTALAPEDAWLVRVALAHHAARLRVHATAIALLHGRPGAGPGAPMSRSILVAPHVHPDRRARLWGFQAAAYDPLADALLDHRARAESLDAVGELQALLEAVAQDADARLPLRLLGAWAVGHVLDLAMALHCGRVARRDADTQADAVRRLAVLARMLLQLRRWTAALYVFTSVVKAFVEPGHTVDLAHVHPALLPPPPGPAAAGEAPWPVNHVLTLMMRQMRMAPAEFCALTLPVVYAPC
ncbi:hypothetical protein GGI15_002249 [Coemansia interrupta]|uniref:Zn(2)-C6 fungal-type domain-containing protein n=1 Tax=Coemansia interrupta TaxID=1126814 RepID=A0A9W8LJM8_9FUNG|nr:hypothetical protein GGI15_002249 [Coemansia interrupta]